MKRILSLSLFFFLLFPAVASETPPESSSETQVADAPEKPNWRRLKRERLHAMAVRNANLKRARDAQKAAMYRKMVRSMIASKNGNRIVCPGGVCR